MSDNGNPTTKNNQNPVAGMELEIVITWDQMTGRLNVRGPCDNTVVFCGMVEAAKDVVFKRAAAMAANSSGIIGASTMPNLRM